MPKKHMTRILTKPKRTGQEPNLGLVGGAAESGRIGRREFFNGWRDRHLEMERVQMMTGCKLTLSRKVREEIARPARPTRALQTSTCAGTIANLDIGRLRADTGTPFSPDKIQTKRSHTQLHKEDSMFFVKRMLVAPVVTAGVSDDVAQELQMPMGPQTLEDVEEPMPARPATLRDPGTPDQIVTEQHSLTHFPSQPWCKM